MFCNSLSPPATLTKCVAAVLLARGGALWNSLFPGIGLPCSLLLRNIEGYNSNSNNRWRCLESRKRQSGAQHDAFV